MEPFISDPHLSSGIRNRLPFQKSDADIAQMKEYLANPEAFAATAPAAAEPAPEAAAAAPAEAAKEEEKEESDDDMVGSD